MNKYQRKEAKEKKRARAEQEMKIEQEMAKVFLLKFSEETQKENKEMLTWFYEKIGVKESELMAALGKRLFSDAGIKKITYKNAIKLQKTFKENFRNV